MTAVLLAGRGEEGSAPLLTAGWCFASGVALFAGSLYVLALGGARWVGAITPLGGLLMMAGWAALAWARLARRI